MSERQRMTENVSSQNLARHKTTTALSFWESLIPLWNRSHDLQVSLCQWCGSSLLDFKKANCECDQWRFADTPIILIESQKVDVDRAVRCVQCTTDFARKARDSQNLDLSTVDLVLFVKRRSASGEKPFARGGTVKSSSYMSIDDICHYNHRK